MSVRFFGIKVLFLSIYFSESGILLSLNGKRGKLLKMPAKGKSFPFLFDPLNAIRFRRIDISLAIGGTPSSLSMTFGSIVSSLSEFLDYLEKTGKLDQGSFRVVPRFGAETGSVIISIRFFTSIAMILASMKHTKKGENNEREVNRNDDG